jgi:hypothetical protein
MDSPSIQLLAATLFERPMALRIPFRFGAVTLHAAPLAFVEVRVALQGGGEAVGIAAELMVPKWFDKNPALTNEQNFEQLRSALALTAQSYGGGGWETPFALAMHCSADIAQKGTESGLDGLVSGFGPALIDRAILDALCRHFGLSLAEAARANLPGLAGKHLPADLRDFAIERLLSGLTPVADIAARHTIGLADPLTATDADAMGLALDGLPRSLDEVIPAYGQRFFKVKLCGDRAADLERLAAIAGQLDRLPYPYRVTLDGNEQFEAADPVAETLAALRDHPATAQLFRSVLFLEQPLKRSVALEVDVSAIGAIAPLLIDESDAGLDAFPRARDRGYRGISSKDCKGVYRSIVNAARCAAWNADGASPAYFLSGEDLTCPSGLAVQQDLALVALLGLDHVERNGHHYFAGMTSAPAAEAGEFLSAHPDLYDAYGEGARLRIADGRIALASIQRPGFGTDVRPNLSGLGHSQLLHRA